jgi:hypothetical protein
VGDEEVRVGRIHEHHVHVVVGDDLQCEAADFAEEVEIREVHRRIVDRRPADPVVDRDAKVLVVAICHEPTLRLAQETRASSGIAAGSR